MSVSTKGVGGFGFYVSNEEETRLTNLHSSELSYYDDNDEVNDVELGEWLIQKLPKDQYEYHSVCEYDDPQGFILVVSRSVAEACLRGEQTAPNIEPLKTLLKQFMVKTENDKPQLFHEVYEF